MTDDEVLDKAKKYSISLTYQQKIYNSGLSYLPLSKILNKVGNNTLSLITVVNCGDFGICLYKTVDKSINELKTEIAKKESNIQEQSDRSREEEDVWLKRFGEKYGKDVSSLLDR